MAYLSEATTHDLARGLSRSHQYIAKIKEKAKSRESEARALAGVAAGSLLFSYLDASQSVDGVEWKVLGAPVSLVAAIALHGLGVSGYLGKKYSSDAHSLGTGALAVYATQWGHTWGRAARTKAAHHGAGAYQYGAGALPAPGARYAVDGVSSYAPAYG